ncbi:PA2G4 protein, partial [Polypterus senegalus]|nr:PA2G4 protein [Polypterus senegalus]
MSGDDEQQEQTIAEDLVVTKYKMGGDIANRVLKMVVDAAKVDASVLGLCDKGDAMIMEETGKIFKKEKEMKKGIAFPTSISVNNCVCHFSPLKSDPDYTLKEGDLVKIDLGVHVDGFIANVAHSFVVGVSKENPVTGRKADVIRAAHLCGEAALRLVKPGNQNSQVTEAWNKIAQSFKCTPVEGMLSHQLKQHVIDGEKTIIQNPTDQQRKDHEKAEFEVHEVYAVDVLVSTGEGKAKDAGQRTTIYKRDPAKQAFEDEKKARMGVVECAKHELLQPFNVLYEKEAFNKLVSVNGQDFNLQLVDTAGQDEYSIFPQSHSLDIHGYVLVYSVTSQKSFEVVQILHDKLLDMVGKVQVPTVLVGNKKDLHMERMIKPEEGKKLADSWGAAFMESSAKENQTAVEVFKRIIMEMEKADGNTQSEDKKCCVM